MVSICACKYVDFDLRVWLQLLFRQLLLDSGSRAFAAVISNVKFGTSYDTLTGLIVVYAALGMPTTLYIMMSYYKTILLLWRKLHILMVAGFSEHLYKYFAAYETGICDCGVLQFLLCWNEFQFALTLTTGTEKRTLPIALYYFKSAFASDYGAMFAATVLVTVPSIIVYMLMQKQVISGLLPVL